MDRESAGRGDGGPAEGRPDIFGADCVDRLLSDADQDRSRLLPLDRGDHIAELFFQVYNLLRSLAYIDYKKTDEGLQSIYTTLAENLGSDVERSPRFFDNLLAVSGLDDVLREIHSLLEMYRESYLVRVRSHREECWERALPSLWRGDKRCASYERCRRDKRAEESLLGCEQFYDGWRDTRLSLPRRENLSREPASLTQEIYDRCALLQSFTVRQRLEGYLARSLREGAGEERRNVHGLVVRLLTLLFDHCLWELSDLLEPATGEKWFFVTPAHS